MKNPSCSAPARGKQMPRFRLVAIAALAGLNGCASLTPLPISLADLRLRGAELDGRPIMVTGCLVRQTMGEDGWYEQHLLVEASSARNTRFDRELDVAVYDWDLNPYVGHWVTLSGTFYETEGSSVHVEGETFNSGGLLFDDVQMVSVGERCIDP